MAEARIIAVSFNGGKAVENISYVWTAGGATAVRRVVEDLWSRRCSYYTVTPSGRVAVTAVPARGPGLLSRALRRRVDAHLSSAAGSRATDSLLTLPRLPSPDRGRRSQQQHAHSAQQSQDSQHSQHSQHSQQSLHSQHSPQSLRSQHAGSAGA